MFSRRLFELAAGEVGRDDRSAAVTGEGTEGNADSHSPKACSQQDGTMPRACEPPVYDPLCGHAGAPGEILAEDRAAGALGENSAGDGAVCKVLTAHHVVRMSARRTKQRNIES